MKEVACQATSFIPYT